MAHTIMEAEKSQDLQSASWRPKQTWLSPSPEAWEPGEVMLYVPVQKLANSRSKRS